MSHSGWVCSHKDLANVIRMTGLGGGPLTIPGHVATIRREIGKSGTPDPILTVPGEGYLLAVGTPRTRPTEHVRPSEDP